MANAMIYAKSKNARNEPSLFGSAPKKDMSSVVSNKTKSSFSAKKDPYPSMKMGNKKSTKKVKSMKKMGY